MVHRVKTTLGLGQAQAILAEALAEGRRRDFLPLTVVVLDAGGQLVAMMREDGSGIARFGIAQAKAWGALGMGLPSAEIGRRLGGNPGFLAGVIASTGGRMAPNAGGLLIGDADGEAIGAVGISGDTGDNDELCARAGIQSAGLRILD